MQVRAPVVFVAKFDGEPKGARHGADGVKSTDSTVASSTRAAPTPSSPCELETRPFAHHTGSMGEPSSSSNSVATKLQALFGGGKKKRGFASGAVPFLFLLALGSWGLSQFLKMPVRAKDEARRRKRRGARSSA